MLNMLMKLTKKKKLVTKSLFLLIPRGMDVIENVDIGQMKY